MKKSTVRKLRQRRKKAVAALQTARVVLETTYPEVKAYLDAQDAAGKAEDGFRAAWCDLTQAQREELIPTFDFWPEAQIILPKDAPTRSRRDMSIGEFDDALDRRNFVLGPTSIQVSTTCQIGLVKRWNKREKTYGIDCRASLARAIEGARLDNLDGEGVVK